MPLPILTERLRIRPVTAEDGADVLAVFGAPAVMRFWNSPPPAGLDEAREWAAYLADMQARLGYAQWHVSERAGGRLVGFAGLQPLDGGPEVELNYALEPARWGRGYATEAARATVRYGFAEAGLEAIVGIAREANSASLRVLDKAGMHFAGPATYFGSQWSKYILTRQQWRASVAPPLVTARLELRRFVEGDLEALHQVFGDPRVMRHVGPARQPLDRYALRASQRRVRRHWRKHGFGPLSVVERAGGRLVGEAGLQVLEAGPEVEVTYTLAHAAWGRGYATEAARAALAWGFDGLGLQHIVAVVYPQNAASLHVVEKLGMRPDGTQLCYGGSLERFVLEAAAWRAAARPPTP